MAARRARRWRATEVSGWLTMITRYPRRPTFSWRWKARAYGTEA